MSNISLQEVGNGRETVKRYLNSKEWWTIVAFDEFSAAVMNEIEDTFYTGNKNGDFHLAIIPYPALIIGLGFAHKRHMTQRQLKNLLLDFGAIKGIDDSNPEQDVLLPIHFEKRDHGQFVISWLDAWLKGEV